MAPFMEARSFSQMRCGRTERYQNDVLPVAFGTSETNDSISGRGRIMRWLAVFLQSRRTSGPMTDVLVRGPALAVMLLACSRVSDALVRCPAAELMVLAC